MPHKRKNPIRRVNPNAIRATTAAGGHGQPSRLKRRKRRRATTPAQAAFRQRR